jgi:exopolysaccharide biosynthesis polyprenyl glycosylphosphotransferase
MIRRYGAELRALLMLVDAGVALCLPIVVSVIRFGPGWPTVWRLALPEPALFLALYAAGWVTMLAANGLYRPRAHWSVRTEAAALFRAVVAMVLASLAVLFWFKLPDVSRLFLILLFPVQYVATLVSRLALRWGFEVLRRRGRNLRYVLVLGAGPRAQAFAAKIEDHRALGLEVIGFLDDNEAIATSNRWPYLGHLDRLEALLHERVVDEVVICLPFTLWNLIDAISQMCEEEGKIVRIPMDVLDRALALGRVEELDGTPVFSLVSGPDRTLALATKRVIDLSVAVLGLLVLSPVFAGIAAAVVLDSGAPVFFAQRRIGLHGRSFQLLKFRTMVHDAENRRAELAARNEINGRAFKVTDDPRVTRVGRFLRRTSLDELPQLWNVVRGDMSLVGPRPPLPEEVDHYDLWHRRRLSMKPGMTGLWQVRDRREPDFDRWVAADLEYIDRWSLWLDFTILLRTIPAALDGR